MTRYSAILLAFYLLRLIEHVTEAKLPKRPIPCKSEILERTIKCREDESNKLLQLLPTDPQALILGIFLGQMLQLCSAAERITQCNAIYKEQGCRFPSNWSSHGVSEPLHLLVESCEDPQIYEKYTELRNCVSQRTEYLKKCYGRLILTGDSHMRINCSTHRLIVQCVVEELRPVCTAPHILPLIQSFTTIGLKHQPARCKPARRNVNSPDPSNLQQDDPIDEKLFGSQFHNSMTPRENYALQTTLFALPLMNLLLQY